MGPLSPPVGSPSSSQMDCSGEPFQLRSFALPIIRPCQWKRRDFWACWLNYGQLSYANSEENTSLFSVSEGGGEGEVWTRSRGMALGRPCALQNGLLWHGKGQAAQLARSKEENFAKSSLEGRGRRDKFVEHPLNPSQADGFPATWHQLGLGRPGTPALWPRHSRH